jgi:hypothetical protein
VTTTYVLDTTTPLTMVLSSTRSVPTTSGNALSASTTRYWHGLDTLAQSDGTSVETFAYDGLGSVRAGRRFFLSTSPHPSTRGAVVPNNHRCSNTRHCLRLCDTIPLFI